MSFDEVFSLLPATENPKQTYINDAPCILHEDHRWVLPLVCVAQGEGLLPKPCTVIMFDRHHDALDPSNAAMQDLRRLRLAPEPYGVVSVCAERLKKIDDDWLKAGMELGLFGDVAIFGVDHCFGMENQIYTDQSGGRHRIEISHLPRAALSYQGSLCDAIRRDDFGSLWEILGWSLSWRSAQFLSGLPKVFLTVDLDCFAIEWDEYIFAWPTKVFEREFLEPRTFGWTGQSFFQELVNKAGLVTIARESGCCGGRADAENILNNLIQYGFDGRVRF